MYMTEVGWWRAVAGKCRAWREHLERSHHLVSATAAPGPAHLFFLSAMRNQKSVLLREIIQFLCQPRVKFFVVQTQKTQLQVRLASEAPSLGLLGLLESRLWQESPNLVERGAGSFLEEVGLKAGCAVFWLTGETL